MIWAGAFFDFLDGFAARLLQKFSSIGKDLDSLADLITFCFLPGSIIYMLIQQNHSGTIWPFFGFLLVVFGALRLAKFNNDSRQTDTFHGLPVPANAIAVSGLPFILKNNTLGLEPVLGSTWVVLSFVVLLSILMISDIRLMSLKFSDYSIQANWQKYTLILLGAIMILTLHFLALPIIILLYVVLSMALNISE